MSGLVIDVIGAPTPQGSKTGFVNPKTGRAVVVDANPKMLKSWRKNVRDEATAVIAELPHWGGPILGPVEVTIAFFIKRPAYHYGTGRNAHLLKPNAPSYVDKKPDVDKLVRGILDALDDAEVYRDDAQVAVLVCGKEYATGRPPGAQIRIAPLDGPHTEVPARAADEAQGSLL